MLPNQEDCFGVNAKCSSRLCSLRFPVRDAIIITEIAIPMLMLNKSTFLTVEATNWNETCEFPKHSSIFCFEFSRYGCQKFRNLTNLHKISQKLQSPKAPSKRQAERNILHIDTLRADSLTDTRTVQVVVSVWKESRWLSVRTILFGRTNFCVRLLRKMAA